MGLVRSSGTSKQTFTHRGARLGVLNGLRGSTALPSDGFSEPSKKAERPVRLKLPEKFRNLRCISSHPTST